MAKLTDSELLDLINQTVSGTPSKLKEDSPQRKLNSLEASATSEAGTDCTHSVMDEPVSIETGCETSKSTHNTCSFGSPGERGDHQRCSDAVLPRKNSPVTVDRSREVQNDISVKTLDEVELCVDHGETVIENNDKLSTQKESACTIIPINSTVGNYSHLEMEQSENNFGIETNALSCPKTKLSQPPTTNIDLSEISKLSKEEVINLLQKARTELDSTKKKLERSERQLAKANDYNGLLRNMVEQLSSEIHRMKHTRLCSVHVQVDKDDFLDYTTGKSTMPSWLPETDDHNSIPMDIIGTDELVNSSTQQAETEGPQMSIADSIKQTAEAVVQQQQTNMLYDQGYVYDESSGLYYHHASGYYYDQEKSLFYDPKTGTYYYYDYSTGEYVFHSQVDLKQYNQGSELPSGKVRVGRKLSGPRKGKVPVKKSQDRDCYPADDMVFKNRKEKRKAQLDERYKNQCRHEREDRYSSGERQKKRKRWHSDSFSSDSEMSRSRSRSPSEHPRSRSPRGRDRNKSSKPRRRTSDSRDRRRIRGNLERTIVLSHSGESDILNSGGNQLGDGKGGRKLENVLEYLNDGTEERNIGDVLGLMNNKNTFSSIDIDTKDSYNELHSDSELIIIEDNDKDENKKTKADEQFSKDVEVICLTESEENNENELNKGSQSYKSFKKSNKNSKKHKHRKHKRKKHKYSGRRHENSDIDSEKMPEVRKSKDKKQDCFDLNEVCDENKSEIESGELSESEPEMRDVTIHSDTPSESEHSSALESSIGDEEMYEDMVEEEEVEQQDVGMKWPPCIRVMVVDSDCLMVGTFFIVTCNGAKLGRENCDICVPDVNVSKVHAEIQFNSGQYEVLDMASQNGTFLNDQRLAPAKIASEAFVLKHDDVITVGATKLLCHIHTGSDTCDRCEPGVVIATHKAQQPQPELKVLSKEERLRQKKQELNKIKKKYGLKNSAYEDNREVFNNAQYCDKAEERRKAVGSDVPGQKHEAPASVHRPISASNLGHKMLQKMGWKEGEALGKNNSGLQEPISVTLRASQTAGLGSSSAGNFSADDANTVDMKKASRRIQAQQRYSKLDSKQTQEVISKKQWTQGDTEFT